MLCHKKTFSMSSAFRILKRFENCQRIATKGPITQKYIF